MKKLLLFLVVSIFAAGCGNKNGSPESLNGTQLKILIDNAISGDTDAAARISMYDAEKLPLKSGYERINIDSIKTGDAKLYYALVQFSDPALNRFAIYDTQNRLLLLDKSLNGEIALDRETINGEKLIKTVESFISRDALSLKRISYYRPDVTASKLIFRTYLSLNTPNVLISQEISKFTMDTIYTALILPAELKDSTADNDTFILNKENGKFVSSKNKFDSLVKKYVMEYNIAQP